MKAILKIKTDPKYFYTFASKKSKNKSKIIVLQDINGELKYEKHEIAEILKLQYESVFSTPKEDIDIKNDFFFNMQDPRQNHLSVIFTEGDIINAIDRLKTNAAPGPDTWNTHVLKTCKEELATPLYNFLRSSLDTGIIPTSLKLANIIPIYKGGDKKLAKNYRPISLTSHIAQLFESIVRTRLYDHIESTNALNCNQHGFRNKRSCLSQLIDHYSGILSALE